MLPPARMYSADSSHSSIVAEMPRLSSTGLRDVAELAQQREVLHVARADLEDVGVLLDQLDLAEVHDLGDQLQVVAVGGVAQQPQPFFAQALEAVRASCAA